MKKNEDNNLEKEIKRIRNLLILIALKSGATSDEANYATGMGAANIRGMFPIKRGKRRAKAK
ncbi:MAG: hypothetical protein F9K48_09085 [Candidatus Brocadia sp.]|nr:MAG: hypothetical protein F9K48_09085 [Candidatus Brocadia sp.]